MNTAPKTDLPATNTEDRRQELARRHESMVAMATGIAHDFNNYVAAIMGNNNVIMRDLTNEKRARECGQRIDSAAALALQLTDQLATYSGRIESNPVALDVDDLFATMVQATATIIPRGVRLVTSKSTDCPTLFGDPALLQRLLVNLVTNSAEAMLDLQGDIQLRASLASKSTAADSDVFRPHPNLKACLGITIKDTGRGMPPAILDRCFDPFFSTKIRGRGMGLPEALGIVRLHEGHIHIHSMPGSGTTVSIRLPLPPQPHA